jgi:hypothetical protein
MLLASAVTVGGDVFTLFASRHIWTIRTAGLVSSTFSAFPLGLSK